MGSVEPMAGRNHNFVRYAPEKIPYAISPRGVTETNRLYGVLNTRLAVCPFVASEYSVADMTAYSWIVSWKRQGKNLHNFPNPKRWFEAIRARNRLLSAFNGLTRKALGYAV